jgi:thioredoxin reductase
MTDAFDVVIVGGGAAGLSAAIVLGRCRRRVILIDAGNPRNRSSQAVHCLLGHEGRAPGELLEIARVELARYPSVTQRSDSAIECANEARLQARKTLLTTGLTAAS